MRVHDYAKWGARKWASNAASDFWEELFQKRIGIRNWKIEDVVFSIMAVVIIPIVLPFAGPPWLITFIIYWIKYQKEWWLSNVTSKKMEK